MGRKMARCSIGQKLLDSARGTAIFEVVATIPLILALIITAIEFSSWFTFSQKMTIVGREASNLAVRRCLKNGTVTSDPDFITCWQMPTVAPLPIVPGGPLWRSINNFSTSEFMGNANLKTSVLVSLWQKGPTSTTPILVNTFCIEPSPGGGNRCAAGVSTRIPGTTLELQNALQTEKVVVVTEVFSQYKTITGMNLFNFARNLDSDFHYYAIIS